MSRAAEWRLLERTGALFAQLFFIAAGVYLGNQADAWKEERSHREAARATLENFRAELAQNRQFLLRRMPYHAALRDSVRAVMQRPAANYGELFRRLHWQGINPFTPAHTARDLALATQALSYIEPKLAFALADVYRNQDGLDRQNQVFLANGFAPTTWALRDPMPLAASLQGYLEDVATYTEPSLLTAYDRILPRLDSALAAAKR